MAYVYLHRRDEATRAARSSKPLAAHPLRMLRLYTRAMVGLEDLASWHPPGSARTLGSPVPVAARERGAMIGEAPRAPAVTMLTSACAFVWRWNPAIGQDAWLKLGVRGSCSRS